MEGTIKSITGAIAGMFFTFAILQGLWAVPDFKATMIPIFDVIAQGIIVGIVLLAVVGAIFLYISIKGR